MSLICYGVIRLDMFGASAMNEPKSTLLVVEDDLGLQKQMRWAFDRFNVVVADSCETALAQLRRYEPVVVTLQYLGMR